MKKMSLPPKSTTIFSLPFPAWSKQEAHVWLCDAAEQHERCLKIYTPNPQMLLHAHQSPAFHAVLRRADLLLPDGIGVVLASRLSQAPLPQRIAGIDRGRDLLSFAAQSGLTVAFLGARQGIAEQAAARLKKVLPDLNVCYTHHGYFDVRGKENATIISELREAAPDLLFVCLGSPAQEEWIDRFSGCIPSLRLCIGLGGSLDVWAGTLRRAPAPISACGLEWLWRTLRQPRRARIFLDIPHFLFLILREKNQKTVVDQT